MATRISLAKPGDIQSLVLIEQSAFDPSLYHLISVQQFRYILTKANAEIWIATSDSTICGMYVLFFRQNSTYARLYSLAVTSAFQGGEVGKKLFVHAEKRVLEKGLTGMLQEVRADNDRLITRYIKLGYEIIGTVKNYYPDGVSGIKLKRDIHG